MKNVDWEICILEVNIVILYNIIEYYDISFI